MPTDLLFLQDTQGKLDLSAIDLSDVDLKRSVSRRHARIVQDESGYVIVEEAGALGLKLRLPTA
mgnify:CR=1 FL=1